MGVSSPESTRRQVINAKSLPKNEAKQVEKPEKMQYILQSTSIFKKKEEKLAS